ncbi:hypothetical protein K435DRAFT_803640 [Dendrothele bispora CBS 962.96]|uniref:Uncharacterized protein n=1 Tax=Dendrothele bispora (strain CBS 962.96) TaxID=1314807 RepID=A0A4S8LGW2_DENBC|nr:hypothetical protein K435DRAFT_803640 [Dendrothele bispora CBS 962.96]
MEEEEQEMLRLSKDPLKVQCGRRPHAKLYAMEFGTQIDSISPEIDASFNSWASTVARGLAALRQSLQRRSGKQYWDNVPAGNASCISQNYPNPRNISSSYRLLHEINICTLNTLYNIIQFNDRIHILMSKFIQTPVALILFATEIIGKKCQ